MSTEHMEFSTKIPSKSKLNWDQEFFKELYNDLVIRAVNKWKFPIHNEWKYHMSKITADLTMLKMFKRAGVFTLEKIVGKMPEDLFFKNLSEMKWPQNQWLRKKKDKDYLATRDLFHDTAGHLPLLNDPNIAYSLQRLGKLYLQQDKEEAKLYITRFYWAIFEFGLCYNPALSETQVIGAGIISSAAEFNYVQTLSEDGLRIRPFNVYEVVNQRFEVYGFQQVYWRIPSLDSIQGLIHELEIHLKAQPWNTHYSQVAQ